MKDIAPTEENFVNFKFHIVVDPVFNACAFPDGTVVINTGLLLQMENPSQLASVMGHEISHVTYRHGRKSYDKNRAIKTAEDAVDIAKSVGLNKEEMLEMTKAFGGPMMTNLFSRSYENQADRNGLTYMSDAGFDPRESPKIWEVLYQKAKVEEDVPDSYIAEGIVKITKKMNHTIYGSHPQALERYRNLNLILAQSYQQKDFSADKEKFEKQTIEYRKFKENLLRAVKGSPKK
jgi:predicted Zn-dependent protease